MISPLIHIGFAKCASSSIQIDFFDACPEIRYLGIQMQDSQALKLVHKICQLDRYGYNLQRKNIVQEIYEFFSVGKTPVISNEDFSSTHYLPFWNISCADRSVVAERLYELFPHSKIVMIIRNQLNVWPSYYAQLAKHLFLRINFDDHFIKCKSDAENGVGSAFDRYDYYACYEIYKNLFGKEKVNIMLFEDFIKKPRKFMIKIASLCGLYGKINIDDYIPGHYNKRRNKLSHRIYDLYHSHKNIGGIIPRPIRRFLYAIAAYVPFKTRNSNPAMKEHQIDYLKAYYSSGNRKLIEAANISLQENGYPT